MHIAPDIMVNHQCIFHNSLFSGQHSHKINIEDIKINASCEAAVWNIETKNALKKPKKPTDIKIEFKYIELKAANRQNTNVAPLYGSVVNALDNNMGICSPHVSFETLINAVSDPTIRMSQAKNHPFLKLN